MRLCPQCDFIYEDDQAFCDMDGKELVHSPATVVVGQTVAPPTKLTISLESRSKSRRFRVPLVAGVGFAIVLSVIYIAQLQRSRSSRAGHSSIQSSVLPTARDTSAQPSFAASPLRRQAGEQFAVQTSSPSSDVAVGSLPPSKASAASVPLTSNPAAAESSPGNHRGPVIVRLNNGASIKADDAWETKEGVWYRQSGMVTFLKRSRVRAIERIPPPGPGAKSSTGNAVEKSKKTDNAADTKKESRVTSFLRKTGRILKKPFKL